MYLEDIPLPEAIARLEIALKEANLWGVLDAEKIPLEESAIDRILAEPVWAKLSSPHYHAAAMDGFAVQSVKTEGAGETQPITLLTGEEAVYIDTGDPIPEFADAVIPIENVEPLEIDGGAAIQVRHPHAIRIP